jgi:small subunit ribosomal protein S1
MSSDPADVPATPASPENSPAAVPAPAPNEASAAQEGQRGDAPGQRFKIGSQRPGSRRERPRVKDMGTELPPAHKAPVPNIRQGLAPEDELELAAAFGNLSLDEALGPMEGAPVQELEVDSRQTATIVSIHNDDVFVEMGGRNQGILSLRAFPEPPQVGQKIPVVVHGFNVEEGLYTLGLPGGAVEVADWSEISQGMVVEARVTGHNKGGLECEVNRIRGFIPAGQISPYRIEDFAPLVGEKMACLVMEANPEKRNLVLSRRAVIERERQQAKEKLMGELAEGQVREGIVRSIQDFGAFVDLGGVDGLIHISQLSWQRVKHPSEVLKVGERVKVIVRKIDQESGKISLAFRDLQDSPWTNITTKYPVTAIVKGTVTRIMDFGVFVELEPGVEGLVHVSELSHGRVFRVRDFVAIGQEVDVKVLNVDSEQQRISLSMKAAAASLAPKKAEPEPEEDDTPAPPPRPPRTDLKGGVQRPSGGEKFGLKW